MHVSFSKANAATEFHLTHLTHGFHGTVDFATLRKQPCCRPHRLHRVGTQNGFQCVHTALAMLRMSALAPHAGPRSHSHTHLVAQAYGQELVQPIRLSMAHILQHSFGSVHALKFQISV